jgi:hypothetical protein
LKQYVPNSFSDNNRSSVLDFGQSTSVRKCLYLVPVASLFSNRVHTTKVVLDLSSAGVRINTVAELDY